MAKEYRHVDGGEGATFSTLEGKLTFSIEDLLASKDVRGTILDKASELAAEMIAGFEQHKDSFTAVEGN